MECISSKSDYQKAGTSYGGSRKAGGQAERILVIWQWDVNQCELIFGLRVGHWLLFRAEMKGESPVCPRVPLDEPGSGIVVRSFCGRVDMNKSPGVLHRQG